MSEQQYFDTLAETVNVAVINRTSAARVVLADVEAAFEELRADPLPYGQVRRRSFRIESYRGRNTQKFFHVIITRLDTGRYELVTYVL